jgi:hypothetical protein
MASLDNRIGETLIELRFRRLRSEAGKVKHGMVLQPIRVHTKNVWDVQCPSRPIASVNFLNATY